jgi:hypothetical protein
VPMVKLELADANCMAQITASVKALVYIRRSAEACFIIAQWLVFGCVAKKSGSHPAGSSRTTTPHHQTLASSFWQNPAPSALPCLRESKLLVSWQKNIPN